ncbi:hypothetical protein CD351_08100 [Erythrobacter sp. KY5]|uniref:cyclic nucleotide-binding domain-containing protein n=1 Tax=Erythrobacter sp. KY5 TaxID=2011159 RepID=UPI000DBF1FFB|nr:cyclic nucleotide-binding domain-containing protein [Erythrobacter sp. KY5]AWW74386.1 hypothetical protein CD351_08100 [Erythrobacter sp. KY5]
MEEASTMAGWAAGAALVLAMLPGQVRTIRIIALVAGILGVAHFALKGELSVASLLAAAFLLVNGLRLVALYRRARTGVMTSEERELFDHVMQIEDPARQNRLRDLMVWNDMEVGEDLIVQGQLDPPLIYIASGRASIVRDGEEVNECGAGEFLGEMSHISGHTASATVKVTKPMRCARIDRDALAQLSKSLPEIGRAVDNAFNRSLAVKVMRMNRASAPANQVGGEQSQT